MKKIAAFVRNENNELEFIEYNCNSVQKFTILAKKQGYTFKGSGVVIYTE